ncbi:hypothetical protein H4582DRAFT_1249317 [Lactarius indigo]|nr:hypothetical protein H4582DRAFT_1249317 [Lactarius indigo]
MSSTRSHNNLLSVFPVYNALPDLSSTNDGLQILHVSCADVEKYLKECEFTPSEKSAACLRVFQSGAARTRIAATQPAMIDVITTALSNPTIFDFVPVFELQASSSMLSLTAHGNPLFAHLWVFLSGTWYVSLEPISLRRPAPQRQRKDK